MSRIFLSHSSKDNASAVALRDWLAAQGWRDIFLDLDPERGIAAGAKWERELNQAALRCEAVLFLVSRAWLASDWCLKEFNLAHRLNKRLFGLLIEDIPVTELPATLTGTWQVVPLASGRDHIALQAVLPGTHDEVHVTFSKEGLMRLRFGLERAGLDARFFAWPPENDPKRSPYRGLLPLEAGDTGIFFGREAPTIEILDRIRGIKDGAAPRFLVLLGASGAGKSSFLRAGLLPRVARDDRNYVVLPVIRPERAAINGEAGLLRALETAFVSSGLVMARADIRAAVQGGAATLRPLLQTVVNKALTALALDDSGARPPMLVLSIDQGEELFLTEGAAESTAFLGLLRELLAEDAPALLVVVTIRSDAYEQLQTAKPLEGVTQQTLSLSPMPRGAYQSVIEGPAARLKDTDRPLFIDPLLTQALLSDIEDGGGRDALPLLAFTLQRLYLEYGARGRLTLPDYNALGRIKGSIEAAVERAFAAADADPRIPRDREARLALLRRGLIPWLAGIDPDTGSPRRVKALVSEIPTEARPLIDLLVEQRLLSTDVEADSGAQTIEPAHESLLRQWGSLQGWLQEDFAALTSLETVKRAARDWVANAKAEDWLAHRAGRLEDAERLLLRQDLAGKLETNDRAYLAACREREEAERKEKTAALERRLRLTRRFSIAAVVAAVVMAGVGLYAYTQKTKANAATEIANAAKTSADKAMDRAKLSLEQSEKNLKQARVNQNRFLSREAALALTNDDPVTAIGLLLEALPQTDGNDTSVVSNPELTSTAGLLSTAIFQLHEFRILSGHENFLFGAAFSPDGTRIVTGAADKTARVWDTNTGAQLAVFAGHDGFAEHEAIVTVSRSAFSPDGTRIVTAGDRTARIWDAVTGTQILVLKAEGGVGIGNAVFSPDGKRIATTCWDNTARVWNAVTGAQIAVLKGHEGSLIELTFSPDGSRVLTRSLDKTARVWDAATGAQIVVLKGRGALDYSPQKIEGSVAFSYDGTRVIYASGDNTATIWDVSTAKEIALLEGHTGRVESVAFSPDGTRVVTGSQDHTARVWNARNGTQTIVLEGHADSVSLAFFSPDSTQIITSSGDATVRVWDAVTGAKIAVLKGHPVGNGVPVASNFDGTRLVTWSFDKTARIWNMIGARITPFKGHDGTVRSVAFSPDGSRIVTSSTDGTARIWNAATGAQIGLLKGHESFLLSANFSPDGSRIVTASGDNTARVWDAATGAQIMSLNGHTGYVSSASYSTDGTRIVTASGDKTARIWDAATGAQIGLLAGHVGSLHSAAFSADGKRIVTAAEDGTARIWDAVSGAQIAWVGLSGYMWSAAFSPDGKRIVTASTSKYAAVWDSVTGARITLLEGHQDGVGSAVFSSDGTRILTSSADKTARVWDASTGAQILVLRGHSGGLNGAAFSPDGSRIVTASEDKTARIWDAPRRLDQLIAVARENVPRCLTPQQRESYFLSPEIPSWCYEMSKWPLKPRS
jgi:WD40 repeat protein